MGRRRARSTVVALCPRPMTERRRSRTDPAVGCTTVRVLKFLVPASGRYELAQLGTPRPVSSGCFSGFGDAVRDTVPGLGQCSGMTPERSVPPGGEGVECLPDTRRSIVSSVRVEIERAIDVGE